MDWQVRPLRYHVPTRIEDPARIVASDLEQWRIGRLGEHDLHFLGRGVERVFDDLEAGGVCLSPECWCKHRIGHGSPPAKPNIAAGIDAGDPARRYNDRRVQRLENCRTDETVVSYQLITP